ncbi:MAG: glycosyltransferase family 2 protein [Candidatus Rokuibacteriota bacterium]
MHARTATIVVNWNGASFLAPCLEAIRAGGSPTHVLLVDNASTDDSVDLVRRRFPHVEVISNPRNDGWARGNNIGIRHALDAGFEFLALFNTDSRPAPGWAREVEHAFDADARLGALGFRLFEGRDPELDRAFQQAARLPDGSIEQRVESLTGAAMAVRAEALREVGLIDEAYFLYCEDLDLCERLRAAGYGLVRLSLPVRHLSEGSSRSTPWQSAYLSMRNSVRLHLRWHGAGAALRHSWGIFRIAGGFDRLKDPDDIRHRYLPGGRLASVAILAGALAWNLIHLPGTIRKAPRVTV